MNTAAANGTLITATFFHNGISYRVSSFKGGSLEIYSTNGYSDAPGLERFLGYARDVNLDLAEKAFDAFRKVPGQRALFPY
jgi:hypothetical protein